MLPRNCDDPAFVKALNDEPGILALAMDRKVDPVTNKVSLEAKPFIVPGARFNEKYGWDSVCQYSIAELIAVLYGTWFAGGWQDRARDEYCRPLYFRNQALQQSAQRQSQLCELGPRLLTLTTVLMPISTALLYRSCASNIQSTGPDKDGAEQSLVEAGDQGGHQRISCILDDQARSRPNFRSVALPTCWPRHSS